MEMEMEMERVLYESAARGDVTTLHQLLHKNPFLLEIVSYTSSNNTPLHVAAIKGHLPFVEEILKVNSALAEGLNSQLSTSLHVASDRGHVEIVKRLADAAPSICLSLDSWGQNPLHIAATKGHVEVIEELVSRAPQTAAERQGGGLTALHLCVKHDHFEALKVLMETVNEAIHVKNDNGDTILHIAAMGHNTEMMIYICQRSKINLNTKNSDGQTAKDTYFQYHPEGIHIIPKNRLYVIINAMVDRMNSTMSGKVDTQKRDGVMVVAILIASMAFQVVVTPPGGLWQEDLTHYDNGTLAANPHKAGMAVMATNNPKDLRKIISASSFSFGFSLFMIVCLISDYPFMGNYLNVVLMYAMWLAVLCITLAYSQSINIVVPNNELNSIIIGMLTFLISFMLLFNFSVGYIRFSITRSIERRRPHWLKKLVDAMEHGYIDDIPASA